LESINKLIHLFMILEQKNLFGSYYLALDNNEVTYKKKAILQFTKQTVPIENLNLKAINISRRFDFNALVIAGFVFVAFIAGIALLEEGLEKNIVSETITGIISFIAGIGFIIYGLFYIRIKVLVPTTSGAIMDFIYNIPSQQEVDEFINTLKATQKKLFLSRYGNYDPLLPIQDQINNLLWLRNNNFLTHEEYEERRKAFVNNNEKRIGY